MYDDKIKILFHLKGGQKEALMMNLIFPDYPDDKTTEPTATDTTNSILNIKGAYTPAVVETPGIDPGSDWNLVRTSTYLVVNKIDHQPNDKLL